LAVSGETRAKKTTAYGSWNRRKECPRWMTEGERRK